ncbi:hypothetical protein ACLB1Q_31325 [Escherichia coli]
MDKDRFRQSLGGLIRPMKPSPAAWGYSWTDLSVHHLAVLLARQDNHSRKMCIERSFLRHFIPLSWLANLPRTTLTIHFV